MPADSAPSRMQQADHFGPVGAQKNRNAVRGKNGERLVGDCRKKAVGFRVNLPPEKLWNELNACAVDLFGSGGMDITMSHLENSGQGPRSSRISLASAGRKRNNVQVCWKKLPLFSEPDCTPRTAIMTSSGLDEASSAVSSAISPVCMRLISAW